MDFLHKKPSSNDNISYTLVSLINYDGDSLDCGNYVSDVSDANAGIWWHCDDGNISQISDLPEGLCFRESHKKIKTMSVSIDVLFVVYIIRSHLKNTALFFNNPPTCPKSLI